MLVGSADETWGDRPIYRSDVRFGFVHVCAPAAGLTLTSGQPTAPLNEAALTLPLQRPALPVAVDTNSLGDFPAPAIAAAAWQRSYRQILFVMDAALVLVATFAAARVRFGAQLPTVRGLSYVALSGAIAAVWFVSLGGVRAYEHRYLGSGTEEYKRVGSASIRLLAMVATLAYIFQLQVARGYVAVALPLGTVLLLIGRYA